MDKITQQNLLKLVNDNYEAIASDFDQTRQKQLWPELEKLTEPVSDGDRVLDAGCGNGRLLSAFYGKEIYYLGIDNSEKLIQAAKKKFLIPNLKQASNFKFIIGNILELDKLSEQDFDYIFCLAVLPHLPGKDLRVQALARLKDKLKAGGKIIISAWNLWDQPKFRNLIFKYAILKVLGKNKMDFGDIQFDWKNSLGQPVSRRYYHAFTAKELRKIAGGANLKINKIYKDKYNYYLILEK